MNGMLQCKGGGEGRDRDRDKIRRKRRRRGRKSVEHWRIEAIIPTNKQTRAKWVDNMKQCV